MEAAKQIDAQPFEVLCDSRNRSKWLATRRSAGIGASEVSAVLGISPFMSPYQLACVKTGKIPEDDLSDNERVFWGNQLEDSIAHGFAERTGRRVVLFQLTLRSLRWPWLTATPDAFTSEHATAEDAARLANLVALLRVALNKGESTERLAAKLAAVIADCGWHPLQIKNIGFGSAEHWAEGVPDYYVAQCRQEAIVCGTPTCTGAALVAGQKLVWDDVERNELADRQIVNLSQSFWRNCLAGVMPPLDGSESTKNAIKAQWPKEKPETLVQLDAEWIDKVYDLERQKAVMKAAKERIDCIENELKETMRDSASALLPDGSGFTYRSQKRAATTIAASEFRVLRRTKAKEGNQ
jgi:putative phage-type endonuclease